MLQHIGDTVNKAEQAFLGDKMKEKRKNGKILVVEVHSQISLTFSTCPENPVQYLGCSLFLKLLVATSGNNVFDTNGLEKNIQSV